MPNASTVVLKLIENLRYFTLFRDRNVKKKIIECLFRLVQSYILKE